jgi:hypothetical protein
VTRPPDPTKPRSIAVIGAFLSFAVLVTAGRAQDAQRPFAALLADPKQPHFFAAWLWVTSPIIKSEVASIGLGENIPFIRGSGGRWEMSVAAGIFSQFNMRTSSNDLINTDFTIGFPLTHRFGAVSTRFQVYHQSSHLGDEYILSADPERVNLSFEAIELLVARDAGRFRLYGGGEYIVRHEPADLEPALLHGGGEYRQPDAEPGLVHIPGLGEGRLTAAVDVKASAERKWGVGWSGRVGIEFRVAMAGATFRRFSLQLQGYSGPAPYGQFYQANVRSVGMGIHLAP